MKTIEQHLQDLFVGKFVKIKVDGKDIHGIVLDIEINRNEFLPDYYFFRFKDNGKSAYLHPEVDTIEILTK
jgi:hypothetical protein